MKKHLILWITKLLLVFFLCFTFSNAIADDPDWDWIDTAIEANYATDPNIHNLKIVSIDSISSSWSNIDTISYKLPDNLIFDWLSTDTLLDFEKSWFIAFESIPEWSQYWENYYYSWSWLSWTVVYSWSTNLDWDDFYWFSGSIATINTWTNIVSLIIDWNDWRYYWLKLIHKDFPEMDRLIYLWMSHVDITPPVCSILLSWENHEQSNYSWREHFWPIYLAQGTWSTPYTDSGTISVYWNWTLSNTSIKWSNISLQCASNYNLSFSWVFITKIIWTWSIYLNWNGFSWTSSYLFENSWINSFTWAIMYTWSNLSVIGSGYTISSTWSSDLWQIFIYWSWDVLVDNCSSYSISNSWSISLNWTSLNYTRNNFIWTNSYYQWVAQIPNFSANSSSLIWGADTIVFESWSTINENLNQIFYVDWGWLEKINNIFEIYNIENLNFTCKEFNPYWISNWINFSSIINSSWSIKNIQILSSATVNASVSIDWSIWSGSIIISWLNGNTNNQIFTWWSLPINWTWSNLIITWSWDIFSIQLSWSWWESKIELNTWSIKIVNCNEEIYVSWDWDSLTWYVAWNVTFWDISLFTWANLIYPWLYVRKTIWNISPNTTAPSSFNISIADNLSWFNSTWNLITFYTWSILSNIAWSWSLSIPSWNIKDSWSCNFLDSIENDESDDLYNCNWYSPNFVFTDKNQLTTKINLRDKSWNTFTCQSPETNIDNHRAYVWSSLTENILTFWTDIFPWNPITYYFELDSTKNEDWVSTPNNTNNTYIRKSDFKISKILYIPSSWSTWSWFEIINWFYYEKWINFLVNETMPQITQSNLPIHFKVDSSIDLMSWSTLLSWINLVAWDKLKLIYSFQDLAWNWNEKTTQVLENSKNYMKVLWNINTNFETIRWSSGIQVFNINAQYQNLINDFKTNLWNIDNVWNSTAIIGNLFEIENSQTDNEIIYKNNWDIVLYWSMNNISGIWNKRVLDLRSQDKAITIWAENWNIYIDSDYLLSSSWNLVIISTKHWTSNYSKWNIFIKENVQVIQSNLIADWSVLSYAIVNYWAWAKIKSLFSFWERKALFRNQLIIEWSSISKNTIWGNDEDQCPSMIYWNNNICDIVDNDLRTYITAMYDLHFLREYYPSISKIEFSPGINVVSPIWHLINQFDNISSLDSALWPALQDLIVTHTVSDLNNINDPNFEHLKSLWEEFTLNDYWDYPVILKPIKPSKEMKFYKGNWTINIEGSNNSQF